MQGSVVEHLGRKALAGSALLGDAVFENGVIEFDVAVNGERSYPGVLFRIASRGNHERVYLRPHHANTARVPDVVQYVAAFNGIDSWQLYGGDGKTAYADLPTGRWLHVRVEVSGTQARVFLDGAEQPALEIHELQRGMSKGGLGLLGPADGSAYFSDFRFRAEDALQFDPPPAAWPAPGFIAEWELSQPLRGDQLDDGKPLGEQQLPPLVWKRVTALPGGLVDVSRHYGRLGPGVDAVVARTRLTASAKEVRRLRFGYSDAISVFLNGRPVFAGDSSYLSRDPSFPGFIGLFDHLFLPLEEGDNDLTIYLYEGFGGWGFEFQDAGAEFAAPGDHEALGDPGGDPLRRVGRLRSGAERLLRVGIRRGKPRPVARPPVPHQARTRRAHRDAALGRRPDPSDGPRARRRHALRGRADGSRRDRRRDREGPGTHSRRRLGHAQQGGARTPTARSSSPTRARG